MNPLFSSKLYVFAGTTREEVRDEPPKTGDEPHIAEAFSTLPPHCLLGSSCIPPLFSSKSEEKPRTDRGFNLNKKRTTMLHTDYIGLLSSSLLVTAGVAGIAGHPIFNKTCNDYI